MNCYKNKNSLIIDKKPRVFDYLMGSTSKIAFFFKEQGKNSDCV